MEGTGNTSDDVDGAPELENEVVQRICDEEETDKWIVVRPARGRRSYDSGRDLVFEGNDSHVCPC